MDDPEFQKWTVLYKNTTSPSVPVDMVPDDSLISEGFEHGKTDLFVIKMLNYVNWALVKGKVSYLW